MSDTSHHSPLPYRWYVFLAWLLRTVYFSRVRIVGAAVPEKPQQMILASHRNGAIDGYSVMAAFPQARFLLSVQLLRKWLLRLMFCGIPVVRDKDRERYGERAGNYPNPILGACVHARAGGSLVMFPEGSSEWGPHPLPYEPGTARIVRMLLAEGVPLEVVPVGLFYQAPDRFRSAVDILVGAPVVLPPQGDLDKRTWEREINTAMMKALDAVSVNCPDTATFERVEKLAAADAVRGGSYAIAFKRWEAAAVAGELPTPSGMGTRTPIWRWLCGLPFLLLCLPIVLVAYAVGRKADARNTVTFFRMVGGFAMALVWVPALLILCGFFPLTMLCLIVLALAGLPAFRR